MSKKAKSNAPKRRKTSPKTDTAIAKETTGTDQEKRRSPRYPSNRVWSNATRERHRDGRDQAIEDAGLVTDRMIKKGQKPKDGD